MLPLVLAALPAWAGPRYQGIDLAALGDTLEAPRYDSSSTGYTVDMKGGIARVFVAPDETAAQWWVQWMAELRARKKPTAPEGPLPFGADEALAGGDDLLILRFGNLGLMVEAAGGALPWVEKLHPLLLPETDPWPEAPALAPGPGGWTVALGFSPAHLSYVGARPLPGPALVFATPPRAVVAWDALGRAVRQDFDASGAPVTAAPPWADFTPPPPVSEPRHD